MSKSKKPAKKQPRKPARRTRRAPERAPAPPPPADPLEAVTAALNAWYYPEIRALEAATLEEARRLAGEGCWSGDLRDKVEEWLCQAIDNHPYVIYTYQSQLVIAASPHSEDWREALGEAEQVTDAQRAYYAILGDVRERVGCDLDALVSEIEERDAIDAADGDAPGDADGESGGES